MTVPKLPLYYELNIYLLATIW